MNNSETESRAIFKCFSNNAFIITGSIADDADLLETAFPVIRVFNDQWTAAVVLLGDLNYYTNPSMIQYIKIVKCD
jgi:hypothetical protein